MSHCGRDCSTCELLDLCGGCHRYCLVEGCYKRGFVIPGITGDCDVCPFQSCPKKTRTKKTEALLSIKPSKVRAKARIGKLPQFVPIINVWNSDSWRRSMSVKTIMVKFHDLFERYGYELLEEDIHDTLDFEGKVLPSSIAVDEFLTPEWFEKYKEAIPLMEPDAVLTWDLPVYVDDPLYRNWTNILKSIKSAEELSELNIPLIGLVKGNDEKQIGFHARRFRSIGIKDMALHCTEYIQLGITGVMEHFLDVIGDYADRILAIGISSPEALRSIEEKITHGKIIPCGLSWYISAQNHRLFSEAGKIDLRRKMITCDCQSCKGRESSEIGRDKDLIASHNLNFVFDYLKGRPPTVKTWDLVIDGRKVVFVSDLHIGTVESAWSDALKFLGREQGDYIVFLGDTFDFKNGRPTVLQVTTFFSELRKLGGTVIPIFGDADASLDYVMKRVGHLSFKVDENPLYSVLKPTDEQAKDALLQLYRFHFNAKRALRIKTNEKEVFAGHFSFFEKPFEEGAIAPSIDIIQALSITREKKRFHCYPTWLVCAHMHVAGIDEKRRIASLGCWQYPTLWYRGYFSERLFGLKTGLVIEKDGTLDIRTLSPSET